MSDEYAWLVERRRGNGHEWLGVVPWRGPTGTICELSWTTDANAALRCARRTDADNLIMLVFQRFPVQGVQAVEHGWAVLRGDAIAGPKPLCMACEAKDAEIAKLCAERDALCHVGNEMVKASRYAAMHAHYGPEDNHTENWMIKATQELEAVLRGRKGGA